MKLEPLARALIRCEKWTDPGKHEGLAIRRATLCNTAVNQESLVVLAQ